MNIYQFLTCQHTLIREIFKFLITFSDIKGLDYFSTETGYHSWEFSIQNIKFTIIRLESLNNHYTLDSNHKSPMIIRTIEDFIKYTEECGAKYG